MYKIKETPPFSLYNMIHQFGEYTETSNKFKQDPPYWPKN